MMGPLSISDRATVDRHPDQLAKLWSRFAGPVRTVAGVAAFFLVAQLVTSLELVPQIYLPRASTIVLRMIELAHDPSFLANLGATIQAWAVGLFVAALISIPVGIVIGSSDLAYRMSSPLIEFMRPIPAVALIPLGIMLWGQGYAMKVILVAYSTTWPILLNTVYGVHDVDPITVQTARCFGLDRFATIHRVSLPSAVPFIFTGIRISASIGLIVVVATELLASADSGIGSYILFVSSGGGHMDLVLACAAITGIVGLLVNSMFVLVDRRLFAWRYRGVARR